MSINVLSRVLGHFHPESEVADRLVLIVLADAAHDDGVTWISQEDIAHKARLSERHVRRCLKELEDRGELQLRKAQRGRRRINVYRVMVAPDLPIYDRLPFTLVEPFTRKVLLTGPLTVPTKGRNTENGAGCPVVDAPDVRSSAHDRSGSPVVDRPPALVLVDGRNLGYDALADEAGIVDGDPRGGEVAAALNGTKNPKAPPGIRGLFWAECVRYVSDREDAELVDQVLAEMLSDPERFERGLERAIHAKAARYREIMKGALLTPGALRKWWVSIERMRPAKGGLTPEEIERLGAAL